MLADQREKIVALLKPAGQELETVHLLIVPGRPELMSYHLMNRERKVLLLLKGFLLCLNWAAVLLLLPLSVWPERQN